MKAVKRALIGAASMALLAMMGTGAAQAGSLVDFRWNPQATSGSLTGATTSIFTSQDLTVGDYAVINASLGLGSISEDAILNVTSLNQEFGPPFNDGVSPLRPNGAPLLAGTYQLYFQVHATSSLGPDGSGGLTGSFQSLTYTLFGVTGGGCDFDITSTAGPTSGGTCGTLVDLASGSLDVGGVNSVAISADGRPSASVDTTIIKDIGAGGFFVDPSNLNGFLFESAFTNTQAITYYCSFGSSIGSAGCISALAGGRLDEAHPYILVRGGGGDVNMVVPEPLTLSIFGAGLVGAATLRRRKAKKA